jgi:hypothetical protein
VDRSTTYGGVVRIPPVPTHNANATIRWTHHHNGHALLRVLIHCFSFVVNDQIDTTVFEQKLLVELVRGRHPHTILNILAPLEVAFHPILFFTVRCAVIVLNVLLKATIFAPRFVECLVIRGASRWSHYVLAAITTADHLSYLIRWSDTPDATGYRIRNIGYTLRCDINT